MSWQYQIVCEARGNANRVGLTGLTLGDARKIAKNLRRASGNKYKVEVMRDEQGNYLPF